MVVKMYSYIELLALIAICLGGWTLIVSCFMVYATRRRKPHLMNAILSVVIIIATIWAVSTHG